VVAVYLPVLCLVDIDERDDKIEGIAGGVETWVSGDAVQGSWVKAGVLKIAGFDQRALMLSEQEGAEYDDIQGRKPSQCSGCLESVPDCHVKYPVEELCFLGAPELPIWRW